MYEYVPKIPKRAEHAVFWSFLFLGLIMIGFSMLDWMPFRWLYQGAAILLLASSLAVRSAFLGRSYRYRVEPRPDAAYDAVPDLVVIEQLGTRVRTVCRISVADIRGILPCTKQNKEQIRSLKKGKKYYEMTSFLFSPASVMLFFADGETLCVARILADEGLLKALQI